MADKVSLKDMVQRGGTDWQDTVNKGADRKNYNAAPDSYDSNVTHRDPEQLDPDWNASNMSIQPGKAKID